MTKMPEPDYVEVADMTEGMYTDPVDHVKAGAKAQRELAIAEGWRKVPSVEEWQERYPELASWYITDAHRWLMEEK